MTYLPFSYNHAAACIECHDKDYVDILKGWKQDTLESEKKTRDLLEKAGRKLNDARKAKRDIKEAAGLLDQAKKAYEFVVRANGVHNAVHNADLAGEILEQGRKDVQKAEELLAAPGAKLGK